MAKNITLNSTNVIGQKNNLYQKEFINGGLEIGHGEGIFVDKLILPNSVCNVSPSLGNTQCAYIMAGNGYIGGTSNSVIAFTLNTAISNSTILSLNITTGFLWIGYSISFTGLTTSTPIYITNISLADVNSATAIVTINQPITLISGSAGTGRIVGNQMIIQTSSGYPVKNIKYDNNRGRNPSGFLTNQGLFAYITNVDLQNQTNSNNIYLITWSHSFLYEANFAYYELTSQIISTYPVNLETGYYDIYGINKALQQACFNNGHYYLNSTPDGYANNGIIYPFVLDYNIPLYRFKLSVNPAPDLSNLTTIYGTTAFINNNIRNPNFDDILIDTSYQQMVNLNGYTIATTNGGTVYLVNGIFNNNSFTVSNLVTSPTGYTQYVILTSTIQSSSTASITQETPTYYPAGTYTMYFLARKTNSGPGDTFFIDPQVAGVLPLTTNAISGSAWNTYTYTFTLTTGSNTQFIFNFSSANATHPIGVCLTGIRIVNANASLNSTYWKNGYNNTLLAFSPSGYQTPSSYFFTALKQLTYVYENKYSLGYYLLYSTTAISYTSFTNQTIPYGLSMNPFYGVSIRCNLVRNIGSTQSTQIISFPLTYPFGSNNYYQGDKRDVMPIEKGIYNRITFELCDQYGNALTFLDNNVLLNFVIGKINLLGI